MKKKLVLRNILIDIGICGVCLVVFALFHHVLPRQQQSVGIVIENPYKTTAPAEEDSGAAITENTEALAAETGDGRWRALLCWEHSPSHPTHCRKRSDIR